VDCDLPQPLEVHRCPNLAQEDVCLAEPKDPVRQALQPDKLWPKARGVCPPWQGGLQGVCYELTKTPAAKNAASPLEKRKKCRT